jgi:Holliday junction DNA helicase RuvA
MPEVGEQVDLRIRQVVREDSITLYGFLEPYQRRLFDLLMNVNGCGPKIALALIGQLGEEAVSAAILAQDAKALSRANGVGQKLAERVILELKDKIAEESLYRKVESALSSRAVARPPIEDTLIDALLALGYRRSEAETAAREAREAADGVEDQLRHALRTLSK